MLLAQSGIFETAIFFTKIQIDDKAESGCPVPLRFKVICYPGINTTPKAGALPGITNAILVFLLFSLFLMVLIGTNCCQL